MGSGAVDQMSEVSMADVPATIATFTVDRLAYSLSPPVVAAVLDFDGGGRFQCELTDVDPTAVAIGDRVEMTFRRLYTQDGVHNYFWKARPLRAGAWAGPPGRQGGMTWHRTASVTRWPSWAWAARPSVSTGTAAPTTC
jgi:hypothetical protein